MAARVLLLLSAALGATVVMQAKPKTKKTEPTPLERYIQAAETREPSRTLPPGSLFDPSGRLGDLGRDQRASRVDDLVTIVVSDQASALAKGNTNSSRQSQAKASVTALGGPTRTAGPLSALADLSGEQKLDGQGATGRESEIKTTITARVLRVMDNGNLIVEGNKNLVINSEHQRVTIRGIVRWNDLSAFNRIPSDRIGELEVQIDGKGVVNDAVRRPNFLYRLLLGILPF